MGGWMDIYVDGRMDGSVSMTVDGYLCGWIREHDRFGQMFCSGQVEPKKNCTPNGKIHLNQQRKLFIGCSTRNPAAQLRLLTNVLYRPWC